MENIPKWSQGLLQQQDLEKIEAAVKSAERKTSGEIVTMVVRRSSVIGAQPLLIFSILALTVLFFDREYSFLNELWFLFLLLPTAYFLSRFDFIQRALIGKHDREFQVHARAELEFGRRGFGKTQNHTGILIFVSLMERVVVVLADKGIAEKLPADTWQGVVNLVLDGIKVRQVGEGFVRAIDLCGGILAQHFPQAADDRDELTNRLIISD